MFYGKLLIQFEPVVSYRLINKSANLGAFYCCSILLIGATFVLLACSSEKMREAPAQHEAQAADMEKVFVSSAEVLPGLSANNEIRVLVKGNLPNPAYEIARYEVNVDGANIDITPWAHHDKNKVVIQLLVAFEDTVAVKINRFGVHELRLNGRGSTVKMEATVTK
ncbi:hypothetical protein KC734_06230 [candidate division KSB1 bacterium]|nr:hypothetical protein [candidate division KSB1 bacterium]